MQPFERGLLSFELIATTLCAVWRSHLATLSLRRRHKGETLSLLSKCICWNCTTNTNPYTITDESDFDQIQIIPDLSFYTNNLRSGIFLRDGDEYILFGSLKTEGERSLIKTDRVDFKRLQTLTVLPDFSSFHTTNETARFLFFFFLDGENTASVGV